MAKAEIPQVHAKAKHPDLTNVDASRFVAHLARNKAFEVMYQQFATIDVRTVLAYQKVGGEEVATALSWHPVSEPPKPGTYLVTDGKRIYLAEYHSMLGRNGAFGIPTVKKRTTTLEHDETVTHWMYNILDLLALPPTWTKQVHMHPVIS